MEKDFIVYEQSASRLPAFEADHGKQRSAEISSWNFRRAFFSLRPWRSWRFHFSETFSCSAEKSDPFSPSGDWLSQLRTQDRR
jgi:hypothetical protein